MVMAKKPFGFYNLQAHVCDQSNLITLLTLT